MDVCLEDIADDDISLKDCKGALREIGISCEKMVALERGGRLTEAGRIAYVGLQNLANLPVDKLHALLRDQIHRWYSRIISWKECAIREPVRPTSSGFRALGYAGVFSAALFVSDILYSLSPGADFRRNVKTVAAFLGYEHLSIVEPAVNEGKNEKYTITHEKEIPYTPDKIGNK